MKFLNENEILCDRNLSALDKFVIDFVKILERYARYVLVSGYVSIVFGRSRATEDVDMLVQKMDYPSFLILFNDLIANGFECTNTSKPEEAFEMLNRFAIRFNKKGKPIPNMEFKVVKNDVDNYSLDRRIALTIGKEKLFISPLEMQIAYKLHLSSEKGDKDIEDARHIYQLFKENVNKEKLLSLMKKFKVEKRFDEIK